MPTLLLLCCIPFVLVAIGIIVADIVSTNRLLRDLEDYGPTPRIYSREFRS